jgi:Putative beta-barrel porin-2, OmpL-like. bbp2
MHQHIRTKSFAIMSAAIAAFLAIGALTVQAQTDTNKLEQENKELKSRLDRLEDILRKEGITPTDAPKDPPVAAMTSVSISGFVTASYFSDLSDSHDNHPPGYLWNSTLNSFTLNKIKLTLASPAVDKDKWDAAYRTSFIWGSDAPVVDTGSTAGGVAAGNGFSWVREAYVEVNVPIGTGLDLRAGDLISLLNYESGDGGAVNDNFSQAYDWYYTGNPPNVGIQAGYDFNQYIGIKVRLENGLYSGPASTGPKTFMGGLYVNPIPMASLAFLGFVGHQDFTPGWDIAGGSFIGSFKLITNCNFTLGTEADYFRFSSFDSTIAGFPGAADSGDFWSIAAWLGADICSNLRVALRGEFLADPTGFGTVYNSPAPLSDASFPTAIYATGAGQDLESVALTLDYKPVPTVKVQPEIRWNHSNYASGFGIDAKKDQIIVGMGVSYLF